MGRRSVLLQVQLLLYLGSPWSSLFNLRKPLVRNKTRSCDCPLLFCNLKPLKNTFHVRSKFKIMSQWSQHEINPKQSFRPDQSLTHLKGGVTSQLVGTNDIKKGLMLDGSNVLSVIMLHFRRDQQTAGFFSIFLVFAWLLSHVKVFTSLLFLLLPFGIIWGKNEEEKK